jgi:hypothetical protein
MRPPIFVSRSYVILFKIVFMGVITVYCAPGIISLGVGRAHHYQLPQVCKFTLSPSHSNWLFAEFAKFETHSVIHPLISHITFMPFMMGRLNCKICVSSPGGPIRC